jgi:formylglycine-generating enzyme required for sulfatase activity
MIVLPVGQFVMGSPPNEEAIYASEGPQHKVTFVNPFAVSKFEVTGDDWDACVADGDCDPNGSCCARARGRHPAGNISWHDAKDYVAWLSRVTGKTYRLLSESEWEYAARAGTQTAYPWGDKTGEGNALCESRDGPGPVGSYAANAFGLFDMMGSIWEWVEDCSHASYAGAPQDGSAWTTDGDCNLRILRGGSSGAYCQDLRPAPRYFYQGDKIPIAGETGFRVARMLDR